MIRSQAVTSCAIRIHDITITVTCTNCKASWKLFRTTNATIDSCGFETYSFLCEWCVTFFAELSILAMTNYQCQYWNRQAILFHIRKQRKIKGNALYDAFHRSRKRSSVMEDDASRFHNLVRSKLSGRDLRKLAISGTYNEEHTFYVHVWNALC